MKVYKYMEGPMSHRPFMWLAIQVVGDFDRQYMLEGYHSVFQPINNHAILLRTFLKEMLRFVRHFLK